MQPCLKFLFLLMGLWTFLGIQAQVPIALYPFTGNANDQSIYANHAVVNGAILTQDRFNYSNRAFAFDGIQSNLIAPNAAHLNTPNITISFWVKVNELPAQGEEYLLSHGGYQERWKISLNKDSNMVFSTNSAAGIKDMGVDSIPIVIGVWQHYVMIHDGAMDKSYVNGVLKNRQPRVGALNNTSKPLGIGFDAFDNANYFKGSLDEVMLFSTALTDAQVTALYNTQKTAPAIVNERVAFYAFSGSGFDSSVYANHATLNNVKATTDRFGFGSKAYEFNGVSSTGKAPNSAQLNSPTTTISFWVKVNQLPAQGHEGYLLSFGGYQERWKISLPNHGKIVFSVKGSDMDAGDGNTLPIGSWKHVVMVHNGTMDKIFIDGLKKAEKAVVSSLPNTVQPLGIGYDPINNSDYFNGALDEVQIYNYALSDSAITALYVSQSAFPGIASDLVADFKLNGNGKDDSQFANHATGNATPDVNRFGYGAHAEKFSGTDSLIASNSVAYQSANTTISFWVKVNQLPAPNSEVILLSHGGYQQRWKISLPSHGKPVFSTNSAGGGKDMDSDSVPLPIGAWRHVVMVHDSATNKIFINGLLKKSISAPGALNKTVRPLGFGYNPVDGGGYFNGDLDDVLIYNRALTDVEIAALYAVQNQPPPITGPLVAYYPFNNNGDDITPYANTAKIEGARPTPDRFNKANKAYLFNNSKATASNSPQLNSAMTSISFWVKVNQLAAPSSEVFLLSHGGYQQRWKISLPSHGKPVFSTNSVGGGNKDMDTDSVSLALGKWVHLVMTHDTITDKIYVNGALKNSKPAPGALKNTTSPFGMGYDPIEGPNYFNGALDDIQVYNIALTGPEVAALYIAQNTKPIETDTIPPTAPLNLTASAPFLNVSLSWLPSTDNVAVTGYNVYKNDTLIMSLPGTSASFNSLPQNTLIKFGVSAFDAAGNESLISTIKVTTGEDQSKDTIPPSIPTNFIAQAGSNSVQLSWTASTDNRSVKAYVVLQDGKVIDTIQAPKTSKFVSGLKSLTAYTFEVYAYDAAGNKSPKAENTVTTLTNVNTGEAGLVASYPFDDNANDATPYANHGVIGGNPTFITHTGFGGKAIKFDGNKDSVFVKNAVQLISDYATISFWIRVDSVNIADAEAYVIDFGHWNQRWKISLPQHLRIVWTTNNKTAQNPSLPSDMDSKDPNTLVKGIWWYVSMVHDGTNDIIYINGIEVNSKPTLGTLNSTARPLVFGNNPIEGGQYFNGALDNVKIYNKALTAAEVKKLFTSGTTPTDDQSSAALLTVVKGLYPNPATSRVTVHHAFTGKEDVLIRVLDQLGRQVDAIHFSKNNIPAGYFTLNVSKYAQGTYMMNFVQDGKSLGVLKFIKQ